MARDVAEPIRVVFPPTPAASRSRLAPPAQYLTPLAVPNVCRYIHRMPRRISNLAIGGPAYEDFLHLLSEMEASLDRGRVLWTAETADAARCRLENLVVRLATIERRLGGDQ